eukprot:gene3767-2671_t
MYEEETYVEGEDHSSPRRDSDDGVGENREDPYEQEGDIAEEEVVEEVEDVEDVEDAEDVDEEEVIEDDQVLEEGYQEGEEAEGEEILNDQPVGDDSDHGDSLHPRAKRIRLVARKPPSKWVLFLSEQRKTVQEANPELSMGEVTKHIANIYKDLPDSELQRLDSIVEEKKREYEEALAHNQQLDAEEGIYGNSNQSSDIPAKGKLLLPLARVKRIIKLDEEVKNVSKESVATIAKATELFIARLALRASTTARIRGGRTVNMNDLLHTIHSVRTFEFLDMDFPKPSTAESKAKSASKRNESSAAAESSERTRPNAAPTKRKVPEAPSNGKYSMLNFISGTKRSSEEAPEEEDDGVAAVAYTTDDADIEEIEDLPASRHTKESPTLPAHLEW